MVRVRAPRKPSNANEPVLTFMSTIRIRSHVAPDAFRVRGGNMLAMASCRAARVTRGAAMRSLYTVW